MRYIVVHIIMALRVYALFGAKRIVIFCLLVLLAIEVFIMVITTVLLEKEPEGSLGDQSPCKSTAASPRSTALFWACPLIGDTIICFDADENETVLNSPRANTHPPFAISRWYAILRCHFCNTYFQPVSHIVGAPQLRAFGVSFTQALATLLVCRIGLNLCKQRGDPPNDSSSVLDTSATRRKNSMVFTSVMPDALAFFGPSTPSSSQFREHNLELDNIRT
ncbi:hypothetical protein K439DRAFT_558044 [Ramaria rubella]|nr:hypothetical protein K439DRAFT_558044 [Ramaria rubella]